jgi:hypothetical protein
LVILTVPRGDSEWHCDALLGTLVARLCRRLLDAMWNRTRNDVKRMTSRIQMWEMLLRRVNHIGLNWQSSQFPAVDVVTEDGGRE